MPAHQALPSGSNTPAPRFVGHLLYPAAPRARPKDQVGGMESLGLLERAVSADGRADGDAGEDIIDRAVQVAVNPRFGMVAVGTEAYAPRIPESRIQC